MIDHGISGVDHPVIAVRNMEQARRVYERLGFTVPPRGSHVEWGTGNWCIMFPKDYLELRGIIDPARYTHHLDEFLARHEGFLGVAFGTGDARVAHDSLAASGLHPGEIRELSRNFELPEGWVQLRFSLCFLVEEDVPGLGLVVLCQHRTPELLRRPEWLSHANGATHVAGVTVAVKSIDEIFPAYWRLFGDAFQAIGPTDAEIRLGDSTLRFTTKQTTVAIQIGVSDLAITREHFHKNCVSFRDAGCKLTVAPAETCGIILEFAEGTGRECR